MGAGAGCEAGAAQPYIKYMRINDSRYTFAFIRGHIPVPAYSYVFHEYINNFQGNQGGLGWAFDVYESPENILYRTAYAFNAGDLLSIMLKLETCLDLAMNAISVGELHRSKSSCTRMRGIGFPANPPQTTRRVSKSVTDGSSRTTMPISYSTG